MATFHNYDFTQSWLDLIELAKRASTKDAVAVFKLKHDEHAKRWMKLDYEQQGQVCWDIHKRMMAIDYQKS